MKHKSKPTTTSDGRSNRIKTDEELAEFARQQEEQRKLHLENVILDLSLASASKFYDRTVSSQRFYCHSACIAEFQNLIILQ